MNACLTQVLRPWHKVRVKLIPQRFLTHPKATFVAAFVAVTLFVAALAMTLPLQNIAIAKDGAKKTAKAVAAAHPAASGLAIPRFVSLASATVHMRAGPGVRYPIAWVYRRKGLPLMVMAEFEYWRKVRDTDGTEGWMHRTLLSGKRNAQLHGTINDLHQTPDAKSRIVLRAEGGVIGKLLACQGAWCRLELGDIRAWLHRSDIFGALPNEEF